VSSNSKIKIHNSKLQKLAKLLLAWFSQNARDLPWRRTRDPYAIWVSEIMLQQTQVKTVIPYWQRWMRELPTIQAAANASPDKIHKLWEGLGYYTRVRNLQKAARQIIAQQNASLKSRRRRGDESQTKKKIETPSAFARLRRDKHVVSYKFPENFEDVVALPGIGRYTAGAICSIAFNQPKPILDGNVIRVLTRIFGIAENPREKKTNTKLWLLAEALVSHASRFTLHASRSNSRTRTMDQDDSACSRLNQSLMELGALICTPRNPQCQICPVKKLCVAFHEDRVGELPNLGRRTTATARRFIAFVIERNGKFFVRQRPAGVVNAHLWEFPNVEVAAGILPAVEPGVLPGGKNADNFKPIKISRKTPGGKMLPSTAGGTPAATTLAHAAKIFGIEPLEAKPLCTVKHSITRYRITLEAWRASSGGASSARPKIGVWKTPAQMQRLAFTSAHKKLASAAADCILSSQ